MGEGFSQCAGLGLRVGCRLESLKGHTPGSLRIPGTPLPYVKKFALLAEGLNFLNFLGASETLEPIS